MQNPKADQTTLHTAAGIRNLDGVLDQTSQFIPIRDQDYESAGQLKKIRTSCRACIANCGVIAHVRDGRVIKLEGDPDDRMSKGSMCAKGLAGIQALYHPSRNKYPLQRVGERGSNQ